MAIRDISTYQWKSNFHERIWTRIKETDANIPNWSYDTLRKKGYYIAIDETNPYTHFALIRESDNAKISFKIKMLNWTMPNIAAMTLLIYGISPLKFSVDQGKEIIAFNANYKITGRYVNTGKRLDIYLGTTREDIYSMIKKIPTTNVNPDTRVTTSQYYVEKLLYSTTSARILMTYTG